MKRELVALIIANILASLGSGLVGPIYYQYSQNLSLDYLSITNLFGTFWIVVAISEIIFGYISDVIDKKVLICLGGALASLATLSYLFIKSLYQLYAAEMLLAIASAMQFPALNSYLSKIAEENKRGRSFALIDSTSTLFYGLATILSGILVTFFSLELLLTLSSLLQASWIFVAHKRMESL
jgi:MFS family permease